MVSKYKEGDKVYFVSSSVFVKEATVIRSSGGFVTDIMYLFLNCS